MTASASSSAASPRIYYRALKEYREHSCERDD